MEGNRPFDVIIFGATGNLGKAITEYFFKHMQQLSWAVAGRNEAKIRSLTAELAEKIEEQKEIPYLIADVTQPASIAEMVAQARVLINCVGPYYQLGEPVVATCIEFYTDYIDLSFEKDYQEHIIASYQAEAEDRNVFCLIGCNPVSISAQVGLLLGQDLMAPGPVFATECEVKFKHNSTILELSGSTWKSLIHTYSLPTKKRPKLKKEDRPFQLQSKRYDDRTAQYLIGANNNSSTSYLAMQTNNSSKFYNSHFKFKQYLSADSFFGWIWMWLVIALFGLICRISILRALANFLTRFHHFSIVRLFTQDGPPPFAVRVVVGAHSSEYLPSTSKPGPHREGVVRVKFPKEWSGGVTGAATSMVSAVLYCLLKRRRKLQKQGGVLTAAAAFGSHLIDEVRNQGVIVQVVPMLLPED